MDPLGAFNDLARPAGSFPSELTELIAREHASEVVRRFLRASPVAVDESGREIAALLESWLARGTADFPECWSDVFSRAGEALRDTNHAALVHHGVALALHLSGSGLPGAWSADLQQPERHRWGRWLLPSSERIAVSSDGNEATLTLLTDGRQVEIPFTRSNGGWITNRDAPVTLLSEVGTGDPGILLLPQAAVREPLAPSVPPVQEVVLPEDACAWRDALGLLEQYAPAYEPWVKRVVRQVAIVAVTPGIVHSGSYRGRYGFIHASARSSSMSMAEVLVHEASHQYFFLLSCLGPVDDGTDTTQYYSPLVDKKRPLDRILFAFHACANIRNFYRLCRANGMADVGYCSENEPIVAQQLKQLDVALRHNQALTSVGRAIYDPIAEEAA